MLPPLTKMRARTEIEEAVAAVSKMEITVKPVAVPAVSPSEFVTELKAMLETWKVGRPINYDWECAEQVELLMKAHGL